MRVVYTLYVYYAHTACADSTGYVHLPGKAAQEASKTAVNYYNANYVDVSLSNCFCQLFINYIMYAYYTMTFARDIIGMPRTKSSVSSIGWISLLAILLTGHTARPLCSCMSLQCHIAWFSLQQHCASMLYVRISYTTYVCTIVYIIVFIQYSALHISLLIYISSFSVKGYSVPRAFIAAQSPMSHTKGDFWELVCHFRTPTIVLLTNFMEGSQVRMSHCTIQ